MSARQQLKAIVPTTLWTSLRRGVTYARRIRIWRAVNRQITGVSQIDKKNLRDASRSGWLSALHALDEWQDPVLLNDARVRVHSVGEFAVRAHSDDLYHVLPSREKAVLAAIRNGLKPGDTFVDAGANIGFYTVVAAKLVGPAGKVVAIEMMPDTAARLREHVRLNDLTNVEVIEFALSDRSGETITATVPDGKYGQASIAASSDTERMRRVDVQTHTLDEILACIPGHVALMKMDLEGAEGLALKGAQQILPRIDALIFELLGTATNVTQFLEQFGFRISKLDGNNMLAENCARNA